MFLQTPPDTSATLKLYQHDLDVRGFVMNLSRAWAWRPDVMKSFSDLRTQLTSESSLSQRDLAIIVCTTAATLGDSYCALAWGQTLANNANPATAAAVLLAADVEDMTPRDLALAHWVRKVAKKPNSTTADDIDTLRAAGFSDPEIFEATAFTAFRVAFSTVNDALGAQPDWQLAESAPSEVRSAVTFGRPVAAH